MDTWLVHSWPPFLCLWVWGGSVPTPQDRRECYTRYLVFCIGTAWPGVSGWSVLAIRLCWFLPFPYPLNPIYQKVYIGSSHKICFTFIYSCFHCHHLAWSFHKFSFILPAGISDSSWLTLIYFPYLLFSCSVMSSSLWPHGLQHARLPCPSLSPRACSNSCPLSWWSTPTISSSVTAFSSCPQYFPASGSFQVSWLFTSGAKILELQLQRQSFQWIFGVDFF